MLGHSKWAPVVAVLVLLGLAPAEKGAPGDTRAGGVHDQKIRGASFVPATLLLSGLAPDAGPLSGATRVELQIQGLTKKYASKLVVSLRKVQSLQRRRSRSGRSVEESFVPLQAGSRGSFFFVTPDCLKTFGEDSRGLLVSVGYLSFPQHQILAGPLLFNLMEPLLKLAPAWASPCCDFKLSGDEGIILAWDLKSPPSEAVVVSFRGDSGHQQEVKGELLFGGEALEATASSKQRVGANIHAPARAWCVRFTTPSWPKVDSVELNVSWNGQQYSRFDSLVHFEEEKSLFGDVVEGISEDHIVQRDGLGVQPVESPGAFAGLNVEKTAVKDLDWLVTIVPDQEETLAQPGREPDMGRAVLLDREGDSFILSRSKDLSHLQEDLRLVHDLFVLTFAAMAGGLLATWARAPCIIGYIVGGAIVGPGTMNCIQELVQVESVAQLGVCMLLFCLGLELSWAKILANTHAALAGLLSMVLVCGAIVLFAAYCTETPIREAWCIGLFVSLASTPVSLQAVREEELQPDPGSSGGAESSTLLAVLVAQDMALALLLAAMPYALSPSREHHMEKGFEKEKTLAGWWIPGFAIALFFIPVLVMAARRCSWREHAVDQLHRMRICLLCLEAENFTLCSLSFAFMLSYASDHCGLSLEMGAFLAGLLIASISEDLASRSLRKLEGPKSIFLAWFFASVGLVVSPRFLFDNLPAILSVVAFTFILKLACGFVPLWLFASKTSHEDAAYSSLRTSWVLAHISEFGFVLAAKGAYYSALSRHAYLLLIGVNAVSLCLAPWQFWVRDLVLPRNGHAQRVGPWERKISEQQVSPRYADSMPTLVGKQGVTAAAGKRATSHAAVVGAGHAVGTLDVSPKA